MLKKMFNIIFFDRFFLLKCHFKTSILRNFFREDFSHIKTPSLITKKQLAQWMLIN